MNYTMQHDSCSAKRIAEFISLFHHYEFECRHNVIEYQTNSNFFQGSYVMGLTDYNIDLPESEKGHPHNMKKVEIITSSDKTQIIRKIAFITSTTVKL